MNRPLSISIVVVTIFSAGMLVGAYFYQWAGQGGVRLVADGVFESQVLFKSYEYAILHRVAMNDSLAASSTDEIVLREARAGIGQIEIFRKALNDYKRPVVGLEAQQALLADLDALESEFRAVIHNKTKQEGTVVPPF